jgi:hypothetical protein
MPVSISSTLAQAAIYSTTEERYTPSNLKLAIRQAGISSIGGSVIQIVHPNAPFILSNGIDLRDLSSTVKNIKIGWNGGQTEEIDAYQLMSVFPVSGQLPSTWTPENFALALNELFKADYAPTGYTAGSSYPYHYPLIAFVHNGEVGIAYDEPDGYVEILTPTSNSAWSALGFFEGEITQSVGPRRFYVDGYEFSSIRKIIDTTGRTQVGFNGVRNISLDLSPFGFDNGGIVRLKESSDNGTYVFNAATSDTLTINEHTSFATDSDVNIIVYADYFVVPSIPANRTLYDLFIDGYDNGRSAELRGTKRLEYNFSSGSTNNPQRWFDIIDVSRSFIKSEKRINYTLDGSDRVVVFGDRGTGLSVDDQGTRYVLPTSNVEGHRFKLYDSSGIDYIELEIADSAFLSISAENAIDVDIYDRISEEKYIQLGRVLHNKTDGFKHLSDRRLFGTIGRKDVRDDYTRDYVSYPTSVLRGNGIFYGFNVRNATTEIDAYGGEILVNGTIYALSRKSFIIPKDGVASTYNLFVDDNGVFNFLKDNQYSSGQIATPSLEEIVASADKTIIAQIDIDASNNILEIKDYRRFVGKIDDRIELSVEENDVTHGSFASLATAIRYINALGTSCPIYKIIRIRGTVEYDVTNGALTLPDGITIIGDNGLYSGSGAISKISLHGTGPTNNSFLIAGENCAIKDIVIEVESGSTVDSLIGQSTSHVTGLKLENCVFKNIYGRYIIRANTINSLIMSNCKINFSNVSGYNNYVISTSNDISNTIIEDGYFAMAATADYNYCLYSFGDFINSRIQNCFLSFPATTDFNNAIVVDNMLESEIMGCTIESPTISTTNSYAIYASSIKKSNIARCTFTRWTNVLSSWSAIEDTFFKNNVITECYQIIVGAGYTKRSIFKENSVVNATRANSVLFEFTNGSELIVIDSNLVSLASTSSGDVFIKLHSCSEAYVTNNVYKVTGATTVGAIRAYGDKVYINNNSLELTGTTGEVIDIMSSSTSTNIQIVNNIITSTASINAGIEFNNKIFNMWIKNNTIDLAGCSSTIMLFGNDAYDVAIENNVLSSTATIDSVISCTGDAYGWIIDNNKFDVTTLSSGFCVMSGKAKDMFINNNYLDASATYDKIVDISDEAVNLYITNNSFITSGSITNGIHLQSNSKNKNIFINGNIIEHGGIVTYGTIDILSSSPRNLFICGNRFYFNGQTLRAIYINGTTNASICNNIIENNYSGNAWGYAIELYNVCNYVNLSNNIIKNVYSNTSGFARGIQVLGGGSTCKNVTISNNSIDGFAYVTSGIIGIFVEDIEGGSIVGNVVTDSKLCLEIKDGSAITVTGNFFENITGHEGVYVWDGAKELTFTGNHFLGSKTSGYTNSLFYVWYGGENIVINNNLFETRNTGSENYVPLACYSTDYLSIMCNTFVGGTFAYAPLTLSSTYPCSNCVVAFNNLRNISSTYTDGKVLVSDSTCIEYMNWGQTYYASIPASHVRMYKQSDGDTTWYSNNSVNAKWRASEVTFQSSEDRLFIEFSSNIVPVGATIESMDIDYDITGVVGNLSFSWREEIFNGSATWLTLGGGGSSENPSSTSGPYTLSLQTSRVMTASTVHSVVFEAIDTGSYFVDYHNARVKYIL